MGEPGLVEAGGGPPEAEVVLNVEDDEGVEGEEEVVVEVAGVEKEVRNTGGVLTNSHTLRLVWVIYLGPPKQFNV